MNRAEVEGLIERAEKRAQFIDLGFAKESERDNLRVHVSRALN